MRDILEDAAQHMQDGYGRAQHMQAPQLPKRFYKDVAVADRENGFFALLLDGKPVRTPGRKTVEVPSRLLAERMAVEWGAQETHIDPLTMPVTRIANTAVEAANAAEDKLRAEIVKYGSSDLLYYRAEEPEELVSRQAEHWDRALESFETRYDVRFNLAKGIVHQDQPPETLTRLEGITGQYDGFALTALVSVTSLTGSAILALGLSDSLFTRDFAWEAAHVDEDFNISRWGEDAEAAARRARRREDFDAALDMLAYLKAE